MEPSVAPSLTFHTPDIAGVQPSRASGDGIMLMCSSMAHEAIRVFLLSTTFADLCNQNAEMPVMLCPIMSV
jgi:hypothetical protein